MLSIEVIIQKKYAKRGITFEVSKFLPKVRNLI